MNENPFESPVTIKDESVQERADSFRLFLFPSILLLVAGIVGAVLAGSFALGQYVTLMPRSNLILCGAVGTILGFGGVFVFTLLANFTADRFFQYALFIFTLGLIAVLSLFFFLFILAVTS
jgi:hypothetical protein